MYEYLFHDLPISNATFAPIDFKFEPGSCLYPDVRAATSNSVMIATGRDERGAQLLAKAVFSTEHWRQAGASQGNGGNAIVLAGMSQWSSPFADMLAYSINTEGQGALPAMDGMNAFGFPWCPVGRAPDVELVENEFPLLIPLSSHWKDSAGHGKYRGGVGTAQMWVAHHVPMVFMMAIADNSKIQTPQGLFGGYAPCTIPGVSVASADLMQRPGGGRRHRPRHHPKSSARTASAASGATSSKGRAPRPYHGERRHHGPPSRPAGPATATRWSATRSRSATTSTRGSSPNGPRSTSTRSSGIRSAGGSTPRPRSGAAPTSARRRIARGRPYTEFEAEWPQRKPPEEILTWYGSWPDAKVVEPLMRP